MSDNHGGKADMPPPTDQLGLDPGAVYPKARRHEMVNAISSVFTIGGRTVAFHGNELSSFVIPTANGAVRHDPDQYVPRDSREASSLRRWKAAVALALGGGSAEDAA